MWATSRFPFDGDAEFDFAGITINGADFGYRDYFEDLCADLARRTDGDFQDEMPRTFDTFRAAARPARADRARIGLGSMNFRRLLLRGAVGRAERR